jgi:hypothetical protein
VEAKPLITHAARQAARVLGDDNSSRHADDTRAARGRRRVNGHSLRKGPWAVLTALSSRDERRGKPDARPSLLDDEDGSSLARSEVERRGAVYSDALAPNVGQRSRRPWTMATSRLHTRAHQHKRTGTQLTRP